ncbi:sugar phosphate isomerase/epimerase family protein [Paenibacillus contaminans]|uniref:Sugar phosphate isomerase/epimerase n=1 Tax=Paenibacillus contaminans TaxID=450362 RepID=A0A329LNF9_9BACL|nr:sugar phosphate isomerase/epimerase [Paenibacillus contaminans]RAV08642.1 sugar phosphate isomerase/epimerase [Paenibacillus contaminans]
MKLGLSSYSLSRAINAGEMTILDAIQWIADNGGEHVEIVPIGFDLTDNLQLAEQIRKKAGDVGIDVSNYAIGSNFLTEEPEAYKAEIERVKKQVDVANALGVKLMRHDVANRKDLSIKQFLSELELLAAACREVADYAAQYGITTSVENHGYFIQYSDRVQALVEAVGRPNFKTTLDIGNFLCADENPVNAVKKNLPYASIVHIKDFYVRPSYRNPGAGWFQSTGGQYLRGAITGQGDIDMWEVLRIVKHSGYNGYLSLEFEGMEECKQGSKIGLENIRRIWDEV